MGCLSHASYAHYTRHQIPHIPGRKSIPEKDLIVLEKLYYKKYPNCGRKRTAMLHSIQHFKENFESDHTANLFDHLVRKAHEARP